MQLVTEPLLGQSLPFSKLVSVSGNESMYVRYFLILTHLMASVMMAARWSLENLMLSVFFAPFLKVIMNSLLG